MMHAKAKLFSDETAPVKIMATADPERQKFSGRDVPPYDDNKWQQVRKDVVYQACRAKFTQNPQLLNQIMSTGTRQFVEASPYDRVWGVGLSHTDPRAEDPTQWKGQNLLGKALTRLRNDLVLGQSATCRPRPSP